jgi:hypothetical protein
MRKSQFSESQIVAFIGRHERGEPVVDVMLGSAKARFINGRPSTAAWIQVSSRS